MRNLIVRSFVMAGLLAGGVGIAAAQQAPRAPEGPRLKLTSPDFTEAGLIAKPSTCLAEGGNAKSPSFRWSNAPKGTASFALTMSGMDNHPQKGIDDEMFWVLWNIPASTTQLPLGVPLGATLPDGSHQVKGGRDIVGYRAPCAPPGVGQLHYVFNLLALDQMLNLPAEATRADFQKAINGHIIGSSIYVGVFGQ